MTAPHRDGSAETLVFLHIPKTAGTTVNSLVRRQYDPRRSYDRLGWPRGVYYARRNVNAQRPAPASIDPATREAIERLNTLDRLLYDTACAEPARAAAETGGFERRLARLRTQSRAYGAYRSAVERLPARARSAARSWRP